MNPKYLLLFVVLAAAARADELSYTYDCDVPPNHPSSGLIVANPCDAPRCFESLQDGYLILEWAETNEDNVNFHRWINIAPEPFPSSLWIEWRFRSNQHIDFNQGGCDARFSTHYRQIHDGVHLFGDAVVSAEGGDYALGLALNEFHHFRFESVDGIQYRFSVDGSVFYADVGISVADLNSYLQFGGFGGCGNFEKINAWDFVRHGTIGDGEAIISSSPPGDMLDAAQFSNLDRFTVTFDQPNYVYVNDITVEVLLKQNRDRDGAVLIAGSIPTVIATRRLDNGSPETVEILLDQPLQVGTTTRFTFNTGASSPQVVEYTLVQSGACCFGSGACLDSNDVDCESQGGQLLEGGVCPVPSGCCMPGGACVNAGNTCCALLGGFSAFVLCEGDADSDGSDAICGDNCPNDSGKLLPGQCGCSVPDSDTDSDTIVDCLDQCPNADDRIDANANGTPDCLESPYIPAASSWGLVIFTLLLITAAKLAYSGRPGFFPKP